MHASLEFHFGTYSRLFHFIPFDHHSRRRIRILEYECCFYKLKRFLLKDIYITLLTIIELRNQSKSQFITEAKKWNKVFHCLPYLKYIFLTILNELFSLLINVNINNRFTKNGSIGLSFFKNKQKKLINFHFNGLFVIELLFLFLSLGHSIIIMKILKISKKKLRNSKIFNECR